MNGQLLIQAREDEAYDFDAEYITTGAPQASDMQHYGSAVHNLTFMLPLQPIIDMYEEASSSSVVALAAQQQNTYAHGIAASHANSIPDGRDGPSKKITSRARKERSSGRQRSSATRTALATPVAAVASSQHPVNWCIQCNAMIPGGADNFMVHVKRKHQRPAALPCPLCNEEFSAHRGAEFLSLHLFGTRRWTQCRALKEAYGVTEHRERVDVNEDNIDVLGNWIVQHRQDIVNAQFTYAVQWPARSTISRMLRRWYERRRALAGTASAGPSSAGE